MIENRPFAVLLQSAEAYLYFRRDWHDFRRGGHYSEADIVMWWQEKERFHCYCSVVIEQETGDALTELINRNIEDEDFQRLIDTSVTLGMGEIATQTDRISTCHFDDTYAVKSHTGLSHAFTANGGLHRDRRVGLVRKLIWDNAPELAKFYKEKFS